MSSTIFCPSCNQLLDESVYFCSNCGKNIRHVPLSTSIQSQAIVYLKSLLLPPFGFIWGYRYYRQSDAKSKIIGIIIILITIVELIWLIQSTVYTVNTVNRQINQQMKIYGL